MSHPNAFPKKERLTGLTDIDRLFAGARSFSLSPFRIFYRIVPEEKVTRILVAVPKKKIRLAVERNRIKRVIREAYRLNKGLIRDPEGLLPTLHVAFVYTSNKAEIDFSDTEKKIQDCLSRLKALISTEN
jgi:ribonuclease P protein component